MNMKNALMALLASGSLVACANGTKAKSASADEAVAAETSAIEAAAQPAQDAIFNDGMLTVNGISYEFALVEAGTFTMGATPEMKNVTSYEKPAHQVTLTHNYYMGKTEVTQALWTAVMGENPSDFEGDNNPVNNVSWTECQEFIAKLNAATGKNFRLPTEAEWEFAAQGGNKSQHYQYSGSNDLKEVAWYSITSRDATHEVATKQANELGLYDMCGNVLEWCSDKFEEYSEAAQTDPTGPDEGTDYVCRGGCYHYKADNCRTFNRDYFNLEDRYASVGFRLAISE